MYRHHLVARGLRLAVSLVLAVGGHSAFGETAFHTLKNDRLVFELTPNYGGLVTSFALEGKDNVLQVGEAIHTRQNPEVSPESPNIPYLGHTVWVGPQSEWWIHQELNKERQSQQAVWPPDPYLALAASKPVQISDQEIVLEGPPSPISGLQLRKRFTLAGNPANAVDLWVEATNVREQPVAWDLWFNTRVDVATKVYVPAASMNQVRVDQQVDKNYGPLRHKLVDGLFTLEQAPPPEGKTGRRGKAFINPSAGWMAAFTQNQLFIISFPLQPQQAIHPEQGQVELYLSEHTENTGNLMELEVHSPYRQLQPGESMAAEERWYLLPYSGPQTQEAHLSFLRENLPESLQMPVPAGR